MKRRHYEVRGSEPTDKWRRNIVCHVLASSLIRAAELALERHPEAELYAIEHRGDADVIEELE